MFIEENISLCVYDFENISNEQNILKDKGIMQKIKLLVLDWQEK